MQDIAALVSGIAGAEGGSAEIYLRGTSIRATYYTNFEGTTSVATGAAVTLDSNGSAVVYVNAIVTVVAKSSSGAVVRTFTAGEEATAITYRGQSFTGVDYTTGASAAGNPISVKAALDKWYDSAGAPDFAVHAGGSIQDLNRAINGLVGIGFNVKDPQFGATGDGVADDTTPIIAAMAAATAAGGGAVVFPSGTYRCTVNVPANVSLVGAGPQSATLVPAATTPQMLLFESSTRLQRVIGLSLGSSAITMVTELVELSAGSRPSFENCRFAQASSGANIIAEGGQPTMARMLNCEVVVPAAATAGSVQVDISAASTGGSIMSGCLFTLPTTLGAGTYGLVNIDKCSISGCTFDSSALTTAGATINCVRAASTSAAGAVSGCAFTNGGGATIVALALGTYATGMIVAEAGNVFGSTVTAYTYSNLTAAAGAQVSLQTREHRVQRITSNATAITTASDLFGVIYINRSGTAALTISGPRAPEGSRLTIVVENKGGGVSGTVVLDNTQFEAGGAGATIANNQFSIYRCRSVTLAANPLWVVESLRENVT